MKIELPEKIYDEIKEYCRVNNIDDVDKFIRKILNQGFTTEKWGVIGENKEPKTEIIEKIIISAITTQPEVKILEKVVISAITIEPEIKVIEKIIYSGTSKPEIKFVEKIIYSGTAEPEIKFVEKIIVSATTNEVIKIVNTGDTINHIYNVYVKPEQPKKEITKPNDNNDLYGERNIRKT